MLQAQSPDAEGQFFAHAHLGFQGGMAHAAKTFRHQVDANVLEAVDLLVPSVLLVLFDYFFDVVEQVVVHGAQGAENGGVGGR